MDLYCWGEKVHIKLCLLNNSKYGLYAVRLSQGGLTEVEDEVTDRRKNCDLTNGADRFSKSGISDTGLRQFAARRTEVEMEKFLHHEFDGCKVIGQRDDRHSDPQITGYNIKGYDLMARECKTDSVSLKIPLDLYLMKSCVELLLRVKGWSWMRVLTQKGRY